MGAAVAFADLGDFRATSFPNVSRLEADQFYFDPEISPEYCFEDIVGKSPALRKVLEQVAIVAPTDSTHRTDEGAPAGAEHFKPGCRNAVLYI